MLVSQKVAFWQSVQRLTLGLVLVWLMANLAGPWLARDLNRVVLFGTAVRFWVLAQMGVLFYLAIIGVYLWQIERLEARYGEEQLEDPLEPPPQ